MAHEKLYQTFFAASWLANFLLFALVSYVLVKVVQAPDETDQGIVLAFSVFILLFLCFSASWLAFLFHKTYQTVVLVIVFMVAQFLCVLITAISVYSDDDVDERKRFSQDPITWIINHRWLPILFALVFLPLFAVQIFMINRYANKLGLSGGSNSANGDRKSTPYHPEGEKIYIRDRAGYGDD